MLVILALLALASAQSQSYTAKYYLTTACGGAVNATAPNFANGACLTVPSYLTGGQQIYTKITVTSPGVSLNATGFTGAGCTGTNLGDTQVTIGACANPAGTGFSYIITVAAGASMAAVSALALLLALLF
jgi:hypothetical protein